MRKALWIIGAVAGLVFVTQCGTSWLGPRLGPRAIGQWLYETQIDSDRHASEPRPSAPPLEPIDGIVEARIGQTLEMLAKAQPNAEAFVVFEDARTERFVQFTGPHITLDLPVSFLPEPDQAAARRMFAGIEGATEYTMQPNIKTIPFEIGSDADRARALTVRIFREVHGVEPEEIDLRITANGF